MSPRLTVVAQAPQIIARRLWSWNPTTRQVVLIAVVAVTTACAASIAAAVALHRIGPQVTRVDKLTQQLAGASTQNYATRRYAALDGCNQREDLKTDLRLILRRFGITSRNLPIRKDGQVVLSPQAGGCLAYVNRTVPESIKP